MPNYRFKDLTGQVFGLLTVVDRSTTRTKGASVRWNCTCACGGVHVVTGAYLTAGRIDHCGCLTHTRLVSTARTRANAQVIDITGLRVGQLVVVSRVSGTRWLCRCDCGGERTARSYSLRAGEPSSCGCIERARPVEERLWECVDKNGPVPPHCPELGPCWVYDSGRGGVYERVDRYRKIRLDDTMELVHRVAFKLVHGRWPEPCGLHRCDNPPCVKVIADEHGPSHIFEGSRADNNMDMTTKGRHGMTKKTHCKRGHPFDEENTRVTNGDHAQRQCRACLRLAKLRHLAKTQNGTSGRGNSP